MVIPAYNVADRLPAVLRGIPTGVSEIIVVNDASTDATHAVALDQGDPRVRVITHARNRGVGAAIATGYCAAVERASDVVVVMAGDGQMDPADLPALVAPVIDGRCDYAKGNRLRHPELLRAMPWLRLVGNVALSFLTRIATGLWHVGDSQCGYTAVHRRVFAVLDPRRMWSRYGYPNHLLGALASAGFRVADVCVRPVYAGERSGIRWRDALVTIPRILLHVARARYGARAGQLTAPSGFAHIPGT